MDHDTKAAIETLTKTVQDGFASVEKRFASLDERMEQGFAAVAEDLADIKDRLTSVESKVSGTNRRLDGARAAAVPTRYVELVVFDPYFTGARK